MSVPLATESHDYALRNSHASATSQSAAPPPSQGVLENEQPADPQVAIGLTLMENMDQTTVNAIARDVLTPPEAPNGHSDRVPVQQSVPTEEKPKKRESALIRAARKLTTNIEPLFSPSRREPKPWKYKTFKRSRFIRLLCLQSDLSTLPELVSFSMDSPYLPYYTTLSYAWGETFDDGSNLSEVLKCKRGPIKISKNLRLALDRVYETQSVWTGDRRKLQWLWVDSICINLADPAERSAQVVIMPEIFARCEQMIVWLGEHSNSTKQWLNTLHSISPGLQGPMFWPKKAEEFTQRLQRLPQNKKEILKTRLGHPPDALPADWIVTYEDIVLGIPRPTAEGSEASLENPRFRNPRGREDFVELTQRPWMHRKWVMQEMAQTRNKYRRFLTANQIQSYEEIESGLRHCSLKHVAKPFNATSHRTLLQNLFDYGDTHCSEPRDHIYALLGISNDVSWLTVDYTQNVESLYTAVAEHYVKNGNYVAILALATVKTAPRRLPSWVPDWREYWQCDRSARHAEVMKRISFSGDRKLWIEEEKIPAEAVTIQYDSKKPVGLKLKAWIVPNCSHSGGDRQAEPNACQKCRLLDCSRGKQPLRDGEAGTSRPNSFSPNVPESEKKRISIVREQFDGTMYTGEVLCCLENCAVGFVLRPARTTQQPSAEVSSYRLEFCFQIDEEATAMTNWFGNKLGAESQEWICIV